MTERTYGHSGSSGSAVRPSITPNPNAPSRHSSVTASSSSSSNISSLGALTDSSESGAEDPADASPLRASVTLSSKRAAVNEVPQYASAKYSTATLGLRSFSNTILSPAQRLAKESLPSPPATSSERGSIGSAGTNTSSQTSIERNASIRKSRPSLPMEALTAHSLDADLATKSASSSSRTNGPATKLDAPSLNAVTGTPSPMPRTGSSNTATTLQRSRSRSPLAEMHGSLISHSDAYDGLPDKIRYEPQGPLMLSARSPVEQSKSREVSPAVSRSGSLRANRIRKTGDAARQRLYERAEVASDQGASTSAAVDLSRLSAASLQRNVSGSSSSTEAASKYESARSSAGDTPPSSGQASRVDRRQSSTLRGGSSEVEGSEAFARSNRNSVISLSRSPGAQMEHTSRRHVTRDSSGDILRTLRNLDSSRELEEGEILDETEPNGIDGVSSRANHRRSRPVSVEVEPPIALAVKAPAVSRQSSTSSHSGHSVQSGRHAVEELRRSGMLSPSKSNARRAEQVSTRHDQHEISYESRRGSMVSSHQVVYDGQADRSLDVPSLPETATRSRYEHVARGVAHARGMSTTQQLPRVPLQSLLPKRSHTSLSIYSDSRSSRGDGSSHGTPARSERSTYERSDGIMTIQSARRPRYSHSPERNALRGSASTRYNADSPRLQHTLRSAGSQYAGDGASDRSPLPSQRNSPRQETRTRSRTLSLRDDRPQEYTRPVSRTDVFAQGSASGHRDKYSTIASSRPRTSASLRDLQIGSADWWQEVSEIRERTAGSVSGDRPASRAGTIDRQSTQSPSPLLPSERDRTLRRANKSPQPNSSSRSESRLSFESHRQSGATTPASLHQRGNGTNLSSTPSSSRRRAQNNSVEHSPHSRPVSRSQTIHTSMSMRRLRTAGATADTGNLKPHQQLLTNALHTFLEQNDQSDSPSSAIRQQAQNLVASANHLGSQTKALLSLLISHQVELELDSDRRSNASRELAHASRIEGSVSLLNRLADDQIRSLTEMLLALAQDHRRHGGLPDSPHESRHGTPRNHARNASETPARSSRMAALPSSSARRPASRLERIDSVSEMEVPQYARSRERLDDSSALPLPSPRALRRAKSSSTSQVSQSTVTGFIASSPPEDRQHAPSSSGSHSSRRSSSAYSQSSTSNAWDDRSVSEARPDARARTPTRSGSRRWRPFSKSPLPNDADLPDSPSIANQNRSSELSRTLSRFSSTRLRA